jgi:hypothetical protein
LFAADEDEDEDDAETVYPKRRSNKFNRLFEESLKPPILAIRSISTLSLICFSIMYVYYDYHFVYSVVSAIWMMNGCINNETEVQMGYG